MANNKVFKTIINRLYLLIIMIFLVVLYYSKAITIDTFMISWILLVICETLENIKDKIKE
jgi:hypothetical protein